MKVKTERKNSDPLEEWEYFSILNQFNITPAPNESFGAAGEHYILWQMVDRLGYSLTSDKWSAYHLAADLLCLQWVEDGYYEKQENS